MKHILVLSLTLMIATGCVALKTRSEMRGENDPEPQRQTARAQAATATKEYKEPKAAAAVARADELDNQMRNLNGRVDTIENQLNQINAATEGEKKSVTEMAKYADQKFTAYEEELRKMDAKVLALETELAALKAAKPEPAPQSTSSAKGKASAYEEGETLFNAKKWKEAIVAFQKYRDTNAKGKMYADATYKIGVCFQELKMKDEAKAFFDEVVTKYPSSKEAKKAAFRMKTLK